MMSRADQHKNTYKEEAYELLAELEESLLELEETPDDTDLISRIFRALHTIKGSGSMFGFVNIARFTHEVETIFDMVRNEELSATKDLIDLILSSSDHIKTLLDNNDAESPELIQNAGEIIASLNKLSPDRAEQIKVDNSPAVSPDGGAEENVNKTYRVRFRPPADIFARGVNPVFLINGMKDLGECRILAQKDNIPILDEIDPESCYIYWDIIITTEQGKEALGEIFMFIEDDCELHIDVIDNSDSLNSGTGYKKLGEILVERGDITPEELRKLLDNQEGKRLGDILIDSRIVTSDKIESALTEQRLVKDNREKKHQKETASSIRVSSDKLDSLVNLVGELVTIQASLTQKSLEMNDPDLQIISEEIERLTEEIRDNSMSIRMIPIGNLFRKFKRLVRDLSGEMKKEINLITEGSETELDKSVIDKLNDPLVHLIRNSIDHGIETPSERTKAGKAPTGTIQLSAMHSGATVLIKIRDDGAGLDTESIRAKAIEKGIIDANAEMTDKEIFSLILAPGFSTAARVTNVSGRGVGMDVVKRGIESLRGSIDIDSRKGFGSTVTLTLPLTLAIIDGLLVSIEGNTFVIPLSIVEECVELTAEDIAKAHGRQIANVRGEIVPHISLRKHFAIHGKMPETEQIVITRLEDRRIGFVVDHVIGEHQTVIKSLGRIYKDIEGISGATILGDGGIALILDIPKLVQTVEEKITECCLN